MAASCQVVRFQKDSTGTTNATQDVNLSFTPVAIRLFSNGGTANNTFEDHHQVILGFSDGTNHACIAAVSDDADTTTETGRIIRNDACFVRLLESMSGSIVIQSQATAAFTTNKVTLTWTVNDTDATYITLVAYGGSDITNAKAGVADVGTTGTGTQNYTGLGFTPTSGNAILFTAMTDQTTANSSSAGCAYGAGFGVSSTKRYCMAGVTENGGNPSDVWNFQSGSRCLVNLDVTTGAIDGYADFSAWVSGGFQLDIENGFGSSTLKFAYLVINGGTWDAGTDTMAASGNKSHTVAVSSNTIRGVGIFSISDSTSDSTISFNTQSFGGSDGTNEAYAGSGEDDASSPTVTARRNSGAGIMGVINPAATATSSTFYSSATFSSFGTNQFTLTYSGASASYIIGWFVVADGAAGGGGGGIDVQCKEFEFTCNTGTGTQTILSNAGFTIKGYILVSVITAANATFESHHNVIIGMSDGTTSGCTAASSEDNVGTADSWRTHTSSAVLHISSFTSEATTDGSAVHSSFGTGDDIVINWTDAPSSAWRVFGLAFGGADMSCEVAQRSVGTTSTGNQSYTTSMTNPEFAIFMATVSGTTPSSTGGDATFGLGVALSTSKRGLIALDSEDAGAAADTWRLLTSSRCVGILDGATGAGGSSPGGESWSADFVSWNANGFTLNIIDAAPSSSTVFYSMCFKTDGTSPFDCGVVAKRTSTGTTVVNTAAGVGELQGLGLFSDCSTDSLTVASHSRISVGLASGTTARGAVWSGDEDAADPTISAKRSENANILRMSDEAATATSSTTLALADLSNFGTETFTLNYSTADGTSADIVWFAIGNNVTSQLFQRSINETSISVSQTLIPRTTPAFTEPSVTVGAGSVVRLLLGVRSIAEGAVTVGAGSVSRLLSAFRTISGTSISTNDSIVPTSIPDISEPSVSTNDSIIPTFIPNIVEAAVTVGAGAISTLLSAFRTISATAISTNDSIVPTFIPNIVEAAVSVGAGAISTLLQAVRTISETEIISEQLVRIQSLIKSISEPAISASDDLVAIIIRAGLIIEPHIKWFYSLFTQRIPRS